MPTVLIHLRTRRRSQTDRDAGDLCDLAGLTYTLGRMTGSRRHGWAVFGPRCRCSSLRESGAYWAEARGNPLLAAWRRPDSDGDVAAATWKARKSASASPTRHSSRL